LEEEVVYFNALEGNYYLNNGANYNKKKDLNTDVKALKMMDLVKQLD
jgi:hypothetical protein